MRAKLKLIIGNMRRGCSHCLRRPVIEFFYIMKVGVKRTKEMFNMALDHWRHEDKKAGMAAPMPYVWARNDETGELVIYTPNRKDAKRIEEVLKREFIIR